MCLKKKKQNLTAKTGLKTELFPAKAEPQKWKCSINAGNLATRELEWLSKTIWQKHVRDHGLPGSPRQQREELLSPGRAAAHSPAEVTLPAGQSTSLSLLLLVPSWTTHPPSRAVLPLSRGALALEPPRSHFSSGLITYQLCDLGQIHLTSLSLSFSIHKMRIIRAAL